jgi:hypothetical protein
MMRVEIYCARRDELKIFPQSYDLRNKVANILSQLHRINDEYSTLFHAFIFFQHLCSVLRIH